MLEQRLITFDQLKDCRAEILDDFIKSCLQSELRQIQNELANPAWNNLGFWKIKKPNGIKRIIAIFEIDQNHVYEMYFKVLGVLEEKKNCSNEKRDPQVAAWYEEKYQALLKWHPDIMAGQMPKVCHEIQLRNSARLFGQVSRHATYLAQKGEVSDESPITILPDELLVDILIKAHPEVPMPEAIRVIRDNFSKPSYKM